MQAEWNAQEAKKNVQAQRPISKARERNDMMAYLKGQGYKGLVKLTHAEMKVLYDAVRESIQKQLDSIIPFDSDKHDKAKDNERSSKRKRTTTDDQPSKKLKETVELRTDTVDELRNYC